MNRNTRLLMVGVIIAISIAALAPYLASSNPDGLESTAGEMDDAENKEAEYYESPMPDYVFPGQEDEGLAGIMAIVLGTVFILIITLIIFTFTSRKNRKSTDIPEEGKNHVR
jgi:cobalt/nickel transport protein